MITRLYQLWLVLAATLIINMVACIILFISGASGGGSAFASSIGYVAGFHVAHAVSSDLGVRVDT